MQYRTVAALFDTHHDYEINLNPVLNCCADLKPDKFILGGDIGDFAYLSHWHELAPGKWESKRLVNDYEWLGGFADQIKAKISKNITYILGNHEYWIEQFMDKFPMLKGIMDIPTGIHAKERGIKIVPYGGIEKIGKLNFIHGNYTGKYHAQQTVDNYGANMRYGHTHDHMVMPKVSALDTRPHNAMSCGCLCNRNPEYNHGRPNKWQHGFYVAYVFADGTFSDYFVPIIKGRFVFNGKVYQ
jgi:predicted phosphodiesterase